MDKKRFWEYEQYPLSAEEYEMFWAIIDQNVLSDEEWSHWADASTALTNND